MLIKLPISNKLVKNLCHVMANHNSTQDLNRSRSSVEFDDFISTYEPLLEENNPQDDSEEEFEDFIEQYGPILQIDQSLQNLSRRLSHITEIPSTITDIGEVNQLYTPTKWDLSIAAKISLPPTDDESDNLSSDDHDHPSQQPLPMGHIRFLNSSASSSYEEEEIIVETETEITTVIKDTEEISEVVSVDESVQKVSVGNIENEVSHKEGYGDTAPDDTVQDDIVSTVNALDMVDAVLFRPNRQLQKNYVTNNFLQHHTEYRICLVSLQTDPLHGLKANYEAQKHPDFYS